MRASLIRCCLALLGLCLWQPLYAGEPLSLRVMTFNLMCPVCGWSDYGRWGLRQGGLIASLREGQPDLLSTQELITPGNLEIVREALPRLDPYYLKRGVPLLDAVLWVDRERFEVLAQGGFWVSDTPDAAIGFNETLSVPRVVIWLRLRDRPTGTTFVLVGLHLDNNRHNKPPAVTLLRDRLPQLGALPLIVAGDFNIQTGSPLMPKLLGSTPPVLVDSYDLASERRLLGVPSGVVERACKDFIQTPYPDCRIDHVLVDAHAGWRAGQHTLDMRRLGPTGNFASDHRALWVDLILPLPPAPRP